MRLRSDSAMMMLRPKLSFAFDPRELLFDLGEAVLGLCEAVKIGPAHGSSGNRSGTSASASPSRRRC
jgi:hypothetical protein